MSLAASVHHGDTEIAQLGDAASDGSPVRRLYRRGDGERIVGGTCRPNPTALELVGGAELARDMSERAGRMARHAFGRDVCLSFGRIADQNVQHMVSASVGDILDLQMEEFGNVLELV